MHGRKTTLSQCHGAPVSDPTVGLNQHTNQPGRRPALPLPAFITEQPDGLLLAIKLQPRASKNEIGEPLDVELRVKVTAPPVDAAANEALMRLLAETLDYPRNKVELVRGQTSRHKLVKVYGLKVAELLANWKAQPDDYVQSVSLSHSGARELNACLLNKRGPAFAHNFRK